MLGAFVLGYEAAGRLNRGYTPRAFSHPNGQISLLGAAAGGVDRVVLEQQDGVLDLPGDPINPGCGYEKQFRNWYGERQPSVARCGSAALVPPSAVPQSAARPADLDCTRVCGRVRRAARQRR